MKPVIKIILILFSLFISQNLFAMDSTTVPASDGYDTLRMVLLIIAILLFFVIFILGSSLQSSYRNHLREKLKSGKQILHFIGIPGLGILFTLMPEELSAQSVFEVGNLSNLPMDVWVYIIVVLLELLVIVFISNKIKSFNTLVYKEDLGTQESWIVRWFNKMNNFRPIEEEAQFDAGHDYDGIRELDNKTPAWWNYTFLFTMIFAVVYLYRYHVAYSAPLPLEELKIAQEIADAQKAEYLKNAANQVDESSVTMSDEAGIAAGASLFAKHCVICHGAKGEGGIGPNMTDDYWLHKGSLKDIFYSLKYGWPQNGMKAWTEELSPAEMAHVASYVKTLRGTNPPNQKDKQGELYVEEESSQAESTQEKDTTSIK